MPGEDAGRVQWRSPCPDRGRGQAPAAPVRVRGGLPEGPLMDVRRSRTVAAPVDDVWKVVRDPYHLPRWWPRTQRVEGVSSDGWTSVLVTDKGRSVRADYRVELIRNGERRRWSQEVAGTPFEKLFREVVYEVVLAPAEGGTEVRLQVHQRPVGWARFGGMMLRRAARKQLDDALDGLAGLLEGEA